MQRDFSENVEPEMREGEISLFADAIMQLQKPLIEATIYAARYQGLRAGVRPNKYVPQPGEEEKLFIPKRLIFVDYPEKTVVWVFKETEENLDWLDSFPQYDQ